MTDSSPHESVAQAMVSLIETITRALVDEPDQVHVETAADRDATVLLLRVAPGDLGKVIGKQGRTARSIRTILGAASMKAQQRFALDIQQVAAPPAPE